VSLVPRDAIMRYSATPKSCKGHTGAPLSRMSLCLAPLRLKVSVGMILLERRRQVDWVRPESSSLLHSFGREAPRVGILSRAAPGYLAGFWPVVLPPDTGGRLGELRCLPSYLLSASASAVGLTAQQTERSLSLE